MVEAIDLGQFNVHRTPDKRDQAIKLTAALFLGKLVKEGTGDATLFHEAMERIMQGPEDIGSVLIMTVNIMFRTVGMYQFRNIAEWLSKEAM